MIDADGFSDERPKEPGTYWVATPGGDWEDLVTIERGPRGLVCVPESHAIPPMLLSAIPRGSLLWRREA
ncbi:MAG: hypothetical protein ABFC89_05390 [Methanospirillum sp.]